MKFYKISSLILLIIFLVAGYMIPYAASQKGTQLFYPTQFTHSIIFYLFAPRSFIILTIYMIFRFVLVYEVQEKG
ncbi:hypothetical protein LguiB_013559 [Lonicera macranthoides]